MFLINKSSKIDIWHKICLEKKSFDTSMNKDIMYKKISTILL